MITSKNIKDALLSVLKGQSCTNWNASSEIRNVVANYIRGQGYADIADRLSVIYHSGNGAYVDIGLKEAESYKGRDKKCETIIYVEWKKCKDPKRPASYRDYQGYLYKDFSVSMHTPTDWQQADLETVVKAYDTMYNNYNLGRDKELAVEQKLYDLVMKEFECDKYRARELMKKAYDDYYKMN